MGDDRGTDAERVLIEEIDAIEDDAAPRLVDGTTTRGDDDPPLLPPSDVDFGTPVGGPYKVADDPLDTTGPFTYLDSEPGDPPPVRGDTR
ncbi:hypothetical protein ADK67_17020 [Saccharothrix sp. NRRL B-16348]|uniref:hypothetical protein n=1 Tax=Saccharothrix sp. NRRL B-16348 TaxID=1415542 RepID=UPI0006AEA2EA|nr:hypothetical protein [Saccharothrix sp. NRRL B-16348]KOX25543.1 hypothetical protein ADK67_17020 [Saccharothrix sp. NRRL B-16348]